MAAALFFNPNKKMLCGSLRKVSSSTTGVGGNGDDGDCYG